MFWLVLLTVACVRHELALVACIPACFVSMVMGFAIGIYAWDTFGTAQALASPAVAWFGARVLARRYRARDLLIAIYTVWAVALLCALMAVNFPDHA